MFIVVFCEVIVIMLMIDGVDFVDENDGWFLLMCLGK